VTSPNLHPNLAKLAAAYDDVVRRLDAGQITVQQANTEIAQLEARDDDGVRWSIDPVTGDWVRKTAFGDSEYDPEPPASGYMTHDAFDYTPDSQVFNPRDLMQLDAVPETNQRPTDLVGATRAMPTRKGRRSLLPTTDSVRSDKPRNSTGTSTGSLPPAVTAVSGKLAALSFRVKVALAALVVAVLAFAFYSPGNDHGTQLPAPTGTPTATVSTHPVTAPPTHPKRTKKAVTKHAKKTH